LYNSWESPEAEPRAALPQQPWVEHGVYLKYVIICCLGLAGWLAISISFLPGRTPLAADLVILLPLLLLIQGHQEAACTRFSFVVMRLVSDATW
jgi:hypothetical protein